MLEGVVVLVTGAASGIGRASVEGFLDDGATVVAVDINKDGLDPLGERGAHPLVVDVTDRGQMAGAVKTAVSDHGRIDVLFNNAGYGLPRRVEDLRPDEWERCVAVHLNGPLYAMTAAIPAMRAQGSGRIVNTLSRGGEGAAPGMSAYAVGKAALWTLTRTVANETRDADILVNGLIPGPTNTGIWGRDRPELQSPSVVYPHVRHLATLPAGGPTGKVFWNGVEYPFMSVAHEGRLADPSNLPDEPKSRPWPRSRS